VQAESLTLAANEGHIQLVLRNSNDQKVEATARRELRDLYSRGIAVDPEPAPRNPVVQNVPAPRPQIHVPAPVLERAPAPVPAVPTPPAVDTIVLIRGTTKTVETFPVDARNHEISK